ncbi:MAG: hypothetical protein ACYTGL_00005, partial [Planctomycetota bacterium]
VVRLACDPADLRLALEAEFDAAILLRHGLLVKSEGGDVVLSPQLNNPQTPLAASFSSDCAIPHRLVTPTGILPVSSEPELFQCLSDAGTKSAASSLKRRIVVAFTFTDLAVLKALRIPVTTATGLAAMKGEQLRLLFGRPKDDPLGEPGGKQRADIARQQVRIVLAGWKVASLRRDEPDELQGLQTLIERAEHVLGFDSSGVSVWRPSTKEVEAIRSAVDIQDEQLIHSFIRESVFESSRSASSVTRSVSKPDTYARAKAELVSEVRRSEFVGDLQRTLCVKLQQLDDLFDVEVTQRLLDEARDVRDPIRGALLVAAADLMSRFHSSSALVREAKWAIKGRRRNSEPDFEDTRNTRELVSQIIGIYREFSR